MQTLWIIVGPVHDAALRVPLVLAEDADLIPRCQPLQARRQVQIVGNQQGLAAIGHDNEALMRRSVAIVAQCALNPAPHQQLLTPRSLLECLPRFIDSPLPGGRRILLRCSAVLFSCGGGSRTRLLQLPRQGSHSARRDNPGKSPDNWFHL